MERDVSPSPAQRPPRPGASAASTRRGVVWLRSGASAPAGLLNALAARGLRVTVVVDAAAALREVIRGEVACLVLHEPAALARVDELLDTLEKYYPRLDAWCFGDGNRDTGSIDRRLRDFHDQANDSAQFDHNGEATTQEQTHEIADRVTVSEAELTMLLGGFDEDSPDEQAEGDPR